jgi:hypothetical protein
VRAQNATLNRRRTLAVICVGALAALAALAAWIDPAALCVLPALALLALMALRRYPGEHVLATLAAARRASPRRAVSNRPLVPSVEQLLPRGGLLLATALAVRPPPRAVADAR